MSIINDALTKARQEKEKKSERQKEDAYQQLPEIHSGQPTIQRPVIVGEKKVASPPLFYIIAAILIAAVLVLYLTFTQKRQSPEISTGLLNIITPSVLSDTKGDIQGRPEFILNGIIHGEGAPMAIINGAVYMVGDNVNKSAKVLKITEDSVLLDKDGATIELKVK
jgi:hypothetical protein